MRDFTTIFGSTMFGGFTAASVASPAGQTSGGTANGTLLAAAAGFGLGLLLTGLRRHDGEGSR